MDVAIVGAGPAGVTTALSLLRQNPSARVALIDKETFPREKICAGAVSARAFRILLRLGVEPNVPSVAISGVRLRTRFGEQHTQHAGMARVVRRCEFDHALVRCAVRAGAVLRMGEKVSHVCERDAGVWVATPRGEIQARYVVGADGVGSVVRRAMGLSAGMLRAQAVEVDTEPVLGDPPRTVLSFDLSQGGFAGYTWDFPTLVEGKALVCRGVYALSHVGPKVNVDAILNEHLRRLGIPSRTARSKRFAERGLEALTPLGRGRLLLVGEAAGIDPLTGEGIAQAVEMGELLGRFLAEQLASPGGKGWEQNLRESRVGRSMALRRSLLPFYEGKKRWAMEAMLTYVPHVARISVRHFSG